ncbi:MAG: hypothetical protein ABIK92_14160 [Pseudomonadota bacterium]
MKHKLLQFNLFLILWLSLVTSLYAGNNEWLAKAHLNIAEPGIVEAVLPPELYVKTLAGGLDLELTGPDGHLRSFELYWREPVGPTRIKLAPMEMSFGKDGDYIWEGKTEQEVSSDLIHVEIADDSFVSRVDVDGFCDNGWVSLKKNQVLFKANNQSRAEMQIDKNVYQKIRVHFKGFDKKYENKFTPVMEVFLSGERYGKDYIEDIITPVYEKSETNGITFVKTVLPGSGIFIRSVNISTQAQFQGVWQIGTDKIENGEQKFSRILNGRISSVTKDRQRLSFDVERTWSGKSLIVRLDPNGAYIGDVSDLKVKVRLPRIVFLADTKGMYILKSGTGKHAKISQFPRERKRPVDHTISFSNPEINKNLRPENLVEKYGIKGGPFDDNGFAWKSKIDVLKPGYYSLVLDMAASLEKNRSGIRLVKDDIQTPFFFAKKENKKVDLSAFSQSEYDPEKNLTTLTIHLPQTSSLWSNLSLHSSGIFKREVLLEIPKPGNMGWNHWKKLKWQNYDTGDSVFTINLSAYPDDRNRLRVNIFHGDNQPIKIHRITASYEAPSINFIAQEKGVYLLYGGNPDTQAPDYDLSMVQSDLLGHLPNKIQMAGMEQFKPRSWEKTIDQLFSNRPWGLYAVLGLVTLIMLFIIAKLFPMKKPE